MRKTMILVAAAAAISLAGCKSKSGNFDEFAVARNQPLIVPPDYTMAPPAAGTISVTPEGAKAQAIEALFGGPAARSAVETSLLDRAGRGDAPVGARSLAGDETTRVVDKGVSTQAILAAPEGNGRDARAN